MAMNAQQAVVANRDIWLPPFRASLPKVLIVANSIPASNAMGRRARSGEGNFFVESM
jgi:hypothetical protein